MYVVISDKEHSTMTEQQLDCALDLMRRLPPQQIEKNLSDLIDLVKNDVVLLRPTFNVSGA